jgi:hypothetical protein
VIATSPAYHDHPPQRLLLNLPYATVPSPPGGKRRPPPGDIPPPRGAWVLSRAGGPTDISAILLHRYINGSKEGQGGETPLQGVGSAVPRLHATNPFFINGIVEPGPSGAPDLRGSRAPRKFARNSSEMGEKVQGSDGGHDRFHTGDLSGSRSHGPGERTASLLRQPSLAEAGQVGGVE